MRLPSIAARGPRSGAPDHGVPPAPPRRIDPPVDHPSRRSVVADLLPHWVALADQPGGRGVLAVLPAHLEELEEAEGVEVAAELLALLEHRLAVVLRGHDLLVPWHGRGFIVLAGAVLAVRDLERLAARLEAAVRSSAPSVGGHVAIVGATIGIASDFGDGAALDRLIGAALAAARSQAECGDGIRLAGFDRNSRPRWDALQEARRAVANGELEVQVQSMVDLATGRSMAFEALVRHLHPVRGLRHPASFLDDLWACGLNERLTELVVDRAAAFAATVDQPVAVNLDRWTSPAPELVTLVLTALSRHGLDTGSFVVEMPEKRLLHESGTGATLAALLTASGVGIAVDAAMGDTDMLIDRLPPGRRLAWYKLHRRWGEPQLRPALGVIAGSVRARLPDTPIVALGIADGEAQQAAAAAGIDWAQGFATGRPRWVGEAPRPSYWGSGSSEDERCT